MTLQEWEEEKDRELDDQLTSLFRSVESPAPPAGFVSRTMKAVRSAPLPEGRQRLRLPWTVPMGWAALVAVAAAASYAVLSVQRHIVAQMLSSFVTLGIHMAMRLVQSVHTSSMVFNLLATISRVLSHALSTREVTGGLISMVAVAAVSLSMLNKLLFSEKESSSW